MAHIDILLRHALQLEASDLHLRVDQVLRGPLSEVVRITQFEVFPVSLPADPLRAEGKGNEHAGRRAAFVTRVVI